MPSLACTMQAVLGNTRSGVVVATMQQIDIGRHHARRLERRARGMQRQIAGEFTFGGDMPFADAGALDDPLIGGIDQLFEIGVGEDAVRQIAAGAENAGIGQAATLVAGVHERI